MDGALQPGQQLAGYQIQALLGRGGMGEVYLARHLTMGRQAALKILTPELADDQEFRQRFLRECQIAAQLDHPNIIPIHDAGTADGRLYIAMRYVEGTDLRSLIRSGDPLPPDRAFTLLWQVADALDAAHAQGVVHRDVKPANILIQHPSVEHTGASGAGERVYLCDFGLGVRAGAASQLTTTGETLGTAAYMAPEQASGQPADARTDAYALACVLFECLTGQPPFQGDTVVATIAQHLHAPVPAVSAARPDLGTALDAVFARALAKTPADRYASCVALLTAVQQAAGGGVGMVGAPVWRPDGPAWDEDTGASLVGEAPGDVFVRYAPSAGPPSVAPGGLPPSGGEGGHRRKVRRLLTAGGVGLVTLALAAAGTLAFANTGDEPQPAPSATAAATTSGPTTTVAPTTTTAPTTTAAAPTTTTAPTTAAQAAPAPPDTTEAPAPPTEAPPATEPPETHPPETEPPETTEPPDARVNDSFHVDSDSKKCPSGGRAEFVDSGPGKPGNGKSNDDYIDVTDTCKNGHGVKAWAWLNDQLLGTRYNGEGEGETVTWDPFPDKNVRGGDVIRLRICEVDGDKDKTPELCRSRTEESADG